jgi:hypothetical protein
MPAWLPTLSDALRNGIRVRVEIGSGGEDGGELGGRREGTTTTNKEKEMAMEETVVAKGRQFS